MSQFELRDLLFFSTGCAMVLAVAKLIAEQSNVVTLTILAALAPPLCYGVAAVAGAMRRSIRKAVRSLLLAGVFMAIAAAGANQHGPLGFLPPLILVCVFWMPQLFLLKICSAFRAAFAASQIK